TCVTAVGRALPPCEPKRVSVHRPPMAWWSRTGGLQSEPKKSVPKGIWAKCERCATTLYDTELAQNLRVCRTCGHHFRMPTGARMGAMFDPGSWQEHDLHLESADPLGFKVDGKRSAASAKATAKKVGPGDACRAGTATIDGHGVEAG